jgi:GT2 family glycosyltransferase
VANEVKSGPLPWDFTFIRASDVFPTNITLIKLRVLERSGLFDLAYNKLARADGDLGTRIYLSGALMVLNPEISVLHHHAPAGGLRVHKARVITYASSRRSLSQRHLPSKSEIYLAKRYFTGRQVREDLWLRAFGTFSLQGSRLRQGVKFIMGAVLLPHTWSTIKRREREAEQMLQEYPQIPTLSILTNHRSHDEG